MSPEQPSPRIRKSPEQVRSAVHQAVIDLLSDPEGADLTIPAIAQRAGVNHTSIYRRWGSREALLADVVTTRLERDWPLKDTGSLRGDLIAWAEAGVASIRTPEGRLLIRAVALSMPGSHTAQGERAQQFQRRIAAIESIRERAAGRGESPPSLEQILDQLIAPLYLRAIFGIDPPASGYPELLVNRLLGGAPGA
ncbi:TetR family transcriptional regulator [Streptomyces sp. NRRL B-1677]|uniref:TetR/AcrR family transcriptional regulator n=1 Tax=Streptomyces klenkii TaxID=1420899 RepID=A0A3B0C0F7_9ACTN|nr:MULTISPECIES: TetR/AcrR family transcriptional regulator [Streptomyces]MBF6049545.1 TetR family transcriptional regulator [Streptomyces sp. NRRL B-1677]RKN77487.1 TetR/AcrR family transcriptional regulator [Streptomyces klenkii]